MRNKASEITKFSFDIFIEIMFAFLLRLFAY